MKYCLTLIILKSILSCSAWSAEVIRTSEELIQELSDLTGVQKQVEATKKIIVRSEVECYPVLIKVKGQLEQYYNKWFTVESFDEAYKAEMKDTFSKEELADIVSFAKTESGRRYFSKINDINEAISTHMVKNVEKHQEELKSIIKEAIDPRNK